jgi:hypothetical protein
MGHFKPNLGKFTMYSQYVYYSTCVVIDGDRIPAFNQVFTSQAAVDVSIY